MHAYSGNLVWTPLLICLTHAIFAHSVLLSLRQLAEQPAFSQTAGQLLCMSSPQIDLGLHMHAQTPIADVMHAYP